MVNVGGNHSNFSEYVKKEEITVVTYVFFCERYLFSRMRNRKLTQFFFRSL